MTAREYILSVLKQVIYEGGYASLLLREKRNLFSSEDNAFISETVYGTLRNYALLNKQWKEYAKHSVRRDTAILLNMSIYHLFFLDKIPTYAVINEAVELSQKRDKAFVNAVLRKVSEKGLVLNEDNTLEALSENTSHPLWILQMWKAHYGEDVARKIAEFNQTRSLVYGRINTIKCDKKELLEDEKIHFVNDYVFTYDGILTNTDYFKEGKVLIQDLSSSLIPTLLDVAKGMKVLDACSAPGTKTQEIAMLMDNDGEIIAQDIYEKRVQLIEHLMLKTGVSIVKTAVQDSSVLNEDYINQFDRVLLDAPCSGLGDLRHKAEIRFHLKPENIDELVSLQSKLLDVNARYVKENGILLYSTCTLNKKENEKQIQSFLKSHQEYELLEEKTLFPYIENSDGFYYAKMRKKG